MLEHVDFDEQQSTDLGGRIAAPRHGGAPPGRGRGRHRLEGARSTPSSTSPRPRTRRIARASSPSTAASCAPTSSSWPRRSTGSSTTARRSSSIAFIPGEPLLAAACEADATLQDYALNKRVVLATPNTLVAALRTIALSWRQDTLAANAREVKELGAELYERLRIWTGHMQSLQKSLASSVEAYNRAVGSLESRVLVTARKLPGLGVLDGDLGPDPGAGSDRVVAPAPPGGRADRRRGRVGRLDHPGRCPRGAPAPARGPDRLRPARWAGTRPADGQHPRRTLPGCSTSTAPIGPTRWCRCWRTWWPSRSTTR